MNRRINREINTSSQRWAQDEKLWHVRGQRQGRRVVIALKGRPRGLRPTTGLSGWPKLPIQATRRAAIAETRDSRSHECVRSINSESQKNAWNYVGKLSARIPVARLAARCRNVCCTAGTHPLIVGKLGCHSLSSAARYL